MTIWLLSAAFTVLFVAFCGAMKGKGEAEAEVESLQAQLSAEHFQLLALEKRAQALMRLGTQLHITAEKEHVQVQGPELEPCVAKPTAPPLLDADEDLA